MDWSKRATPWLALLAFLIPAAVYMRTLAPTVPFWDAGEFIACSYILGIPHPPGTPLYVLLGRVATLVPWATVAQRINALSAIPCALAVMLTYLTTLRLIRIAQGPERTATREWIAHVGAMTGALLFAFCDDFWESAIEAEVYSLMSLAQILVLWLGLKWWEEHERRPTAGPLLLCVYVMWLSVGFHLGVGMMGLPLMVVVWLVDRRAALVFAMPFLAVLFVVTGLEKMAGWVLVLSTLVFVGYAWQKKLNGWVVAGGAVAAVICLGPAFGDAPFNRWTALLALGSIGVPLALLARRTREGKILALALFLMVVGYSTHAYLPIRAAQHPAINEGDPSNWDNFRDLLERKQYGQMNMFVRRAPLSVQLDKEFWRYFRRQWPLFPTDRLIGALLPLLLGLLGGAWQARRNLTTFFYTGCFLGLTTAGMIVFLNFSPSEVRERDYFFQSGYHAYALWIGLGVAWMIGWVRDSFAEGPMRSYAAAAAAVLLASQPFLLMKNLWFTHDRRGNYVAHDYAYNMLEPLAPNSFMFTNGDNDTFPLWYMQQVEGLRKDVRVVNLSLLNTDWYIRQLRDDEPRVPITLNDEQIKQLGQGYFRDSTGAFEYTNQYMVAHMIDVDHGDRGWKKQPYFAVTVPEHMGLEKYFSLEGLVYRVNRDTLQDPVDEPATARALYQVFRYRGLFRDDGSWDTSVYKDENASTLSRNYAAAHLQLAFWYRHHGSLERGIGEMERVARMFPDFTEVQIPLGNFYMEHGDTGKAVELYRKLAQRNPRDPEARYYFGVTQVYQGHLAEALKEFDAAIQADPNYSMAYYAAYYALMEGGQRERALAYLERYVSSHPDDDQARQVLEGQRGNTPAPPVRPPLPELQ